MTNDEPDDKLRYDCEDASRAMGISKEALKESSIAPRRSRSRQIGGKIQATHP